MKIQNIHDARVHVRLPSALLDDLKADALENMRSLNDHIVWILRDHMRSEREKGFERHPSAEPMR